jgi:hypothetical protein
VLVFAWPLHVEPGESVCVGVRLAVTQDRDLSAVELGVPGAEST